MIGDLTVRIEYLSHGFRLVPRGEMDISNVEELRRAIAGCWAIAPSFCRSTSAR